MRCRNGYTTQARFPDDDRARGESTRLPVRDHRVDTEMFVFELRPLSETEFFLYGPHALATGRAKVTFSVDEEGTVQGLELAAERFYFDAKKVR